MNDLAKPVVTRYAPSPTGFQHIGGIRTALFAYLYAKKNKGTFILRIEDTDKNREVEGSIKHTIDVLTWLGIEYDFGPDKPGDFGSTIQSKRMPVYKAYAQKLIDKGLAYPDPYTEDEITAFRSEAEVNKQPYLYRNHRPEETGEWDGTVPLRLKVPEIKRYSWIDEVRGELSAGVEMLDDFILIKADGYPTYNFAHIVDDHEMGVTHVMRGAEFIASTPKYLSLYDALGIEWPKFVTLPPIMSPDGKKKLSKRDGAKDILEYRDEGYLPQAIVNFLALIGWNPGTEQELFSQEELIASFSLTGIQRGGGAFNQDKLLWMNGEYYRRLDHEAFLTIIQNALPEATKNLPDFAIERLKKLLPTIQERVRVASEITDAATKGEYDFAFCDPDVPKDMLKWKNDPDVSLVLPRLQKLTSLLQDADFSSPDTIKSAIWSYAEAEGKGEVLWPFRVALTGREQSPDPFTVAYIIGMPDTLKRLKLACDKIDG